MPRLPRVDVANEIYHVINRANGRTQIFSVPEDYRSFENMKKIKKPTLNAEEKRILSGIEAGEFKSNPKLKQEIRRHSEIAKNTTAKNKAISIRVSSVDLMKLKAKAYQEGVPYQTLISSSIHRLTA